MSLPRFLLLTLAPIAALISPAIADEVILDEVPVGDLANWERVDVVALNPVLTTEEIVSPEDGSMALRLSVVGNSLSSCESKGLRRVFDVGPSSTAASELEAYLEFAFDGSHYNLPSVRIELLDATDAAVGYHDGSRSPHAPAGHAG